MGRREASAYKRVDLLMLPAIVLGVFVPMLVEGPLRWLGLAIGSALMLAAVVAFFSTSKAAHDDYRAGDQGSDRGRAE
jgi:hypothetical protein